jgi:putative phosphoesterase
VEIGILSDTHNDSAITQTALQGFQQRGVRTVFHCGDVTSADMVGHFQGFDAYFVRGNMDRQHGQALKAAVKAQPGAHWLGKGDEIALDGKRIALTHGDSREQYEALLFGEPDYLLVGHTHRRRDERIGPTRVINPGALGGVQYEVRSICVLDLTSDQLEVIHLSQ